MTALLLLGGLSPRTFLRRHWQKRPLLVRGAFPRFRDPVPPARLLRLATREGVESRLVRERGGPRPWQVVPGPLPPALLRRLGPSHWTVLVHGVDTHVSAVADLVEAFDFLPRWRIDDVMVSLASPLGSVGPHVDSYDVFLLQGRGRRRWRIARRFEAATRPGLDLRVLRRFRAEQEWVLEPGDLLYLPPGVAHHGVALEECLTYSIGFRAPAQVEIAAGFLQQVIAGLDRARLYADPDLGGQDEPGEIPPDALARLRAMVRDATGTLDGPAFDRFVGEHLTAPPAASVRRRHPVDTAVLRTALRAAVPLVRRPGARIAFLRRGRGLLLFADGRHWALPPALASTAPVLTRHRRLSPRSLEPFRGRPGFVELMAQLVSAGVFRVAGGGSAAASHRGRRGSRRARDSSRTRRRR